MVKDSTEFPWCNDTWFRCLSGVCINVTLTCDNVTDCPDGSDEDREYAQCSDGLSTGLIAAIVVGSLVGAVLLCCWVGSIIECVQHVYKYWCSCCHHSDSNDFHVTTVLGNPNADPSTIIVAGRLPPSYSSIFQSETADTFRNDSAFHHDITSSVSLGSEFRTYQNGFGPRSVDQCHYTRRTSGITETVCDSPARRSGTMDSFPCSVPCRSGTMDAIHCSPSHRPRPRGGSEQFACAPISRTRFGTMDTINCSPTHRSRSTRTSSSLHCSPTHRARNVNHTNFPQSNISEAAEAIRCLSAHRPSITNSPVHCSPTHRRRISEDATCTRNNISEIMEVIHCSPTHRPAIDTSAQCSPIHRPHTDHHFQPPLNHISDTTNAFHCSPVHRYGPMDTFNYVPASTSESMATFNCTQSNNITNMPDITENLNEVNNSDQCCSTGIDERNTCTFHLDTCPEPKETYVHSCKTANAAVQVDLIPPTFYEGRSSIRWC